MITTKFNTITIPVNICIYTHIYIHFSYSASLKDIKLYKVIMIPIIIVIVRYINILCRIKNTQKKRNEAIPFSVSGIKLI